MTETAGAENALDHYVQTAPSAQNLADIFRGNWTSSLPGLESGNSPLFDDERITWGIDALGGVEGAEVLELGPYEAGHTYMLHKRGAKHVTAIEGNTRSFLKCLVVKEIYDLPASFRCGLFDEYFASCDRRFDVIWASGVLYHMQNPVELIRDIASRTDRVFFWTQYFDADRIAQHSYLVDKFDKGQPFEVDGFSCTVYTHEYMEALDNVNYAGGSQSTTRWLTRADLLRCLKHFGFDDVTVPPQHEHPDFMHGPCLALVAKRTRSPWKRFTNRFRRLLERHDG